MLVAIASWLLALVPLASAWAQTPVWGVATAGTPDQASSTSQLLASTVDSDGNVLVAGYFTGKLTLGNTLLTSAGGQDLFVAKWLPASSTWTWALRGGGTGDDQAQGLAVSGTALYVTGFLTNTASNAAGVTLNTTTVAGVSTVTGPTATADLFVAKFTNNSGVALQWAQVGGGAGADQGSAVAVRTSGSTTTVYVAGSITDDTNDTNKVVFGSAKSQYGASATSSLDLVVAKYTDNGTSATLGWTQVGGGTKADAGQGIAVNGTSVYVTGYLTNNKGDADQVLFGGTGPTAGTKQQLGAGTTSGAANFSDLLLAKYTDGGTSATSVWTQVGGGTAADQGLGVAVSGTSVYVTGFINNNSGNTTKVLFGGTGTTAGTATQYGAAAVSNDLVVAKYSDGGASSTFSWSQVGGGGGDDAGQAIAVSSSTLYVAGTLVNNATNANNVLFGGSGATLGTTTQNGASGTTSSDILAASYADNGSSATLNWTQIGGGTGADQGRGIALTSTQEYIVGDIIPPATFSNLTIADPAGSDVSFLGRLAPAGPLPVTLVRFGATAVASSPAVRLAWTTASEWNSSYFSIERSLDGVTYTALGQVSASGTSAATHEYAWVDTAPLTGRPSLYYRLRQVDQNGAFTYSPVCSVAVTTGLALYPNPALETTTLSGIVPNATVQLLDVQGRVVRTAVADATGSTRLNVGSSSLPAGWYLVRAGSQTTRLLVQ